MYTRTLNPIPYLRNGAQQIPQSQIDDAANVYKAEILKKSTPYGDLLQEIHWGADFWEYVFLCAAIPHLTSVYHPAAN